MTLNAELWPEALESCGENSYGLLNNSSIFNHIDEVTDNLNDLAFSDGFELPNGIHDSDLLFDFLIIQCANQEALFNINADSGLQGQLMLLLYII